MATSSGIVALTLSDEPITRPRPEPLAEVGLEGKRILVTGGTTGIGRATAVRLAEKGARVFVFGRHRQELDDALAAIHARTGATALGTTADQTRKADLDHVFDQVDREFGGLDVLINNAGIGGSGLMESDYAEWEYLLQTNVLGHMACAKKAVERMTAGGGGHIVHVGSLSADARDPGDQVYSATKAAIQAFSQSLRKSLARQGIKVSLIEPGSVGTDMVADRIPPSEQRQKEDRNEMLMAEDIADAIVTVLTRPGRVTIDLMRVTPTMLPE
ncbi:MAG: SDR family oxidoreductase [Armatimonadetes bacterium]|nr:SDR family oxidoreductase [Armatimonadota bacterium]